jgi:nicotinamide mononucleotide transporter
MPVASSVLSWLQLHYLELLAVITGLLYVVFTIREKTILWLFGILSSGLYVWIFYRSSLYAYAVLYIYYVFIGIYGWYNWARKSSGSGRQSLSIGKTTVFMRWICLLVTGILVWPLFLILKDFTTPGMALADAVLTSGGMVATWMLTQKYIEQWIFWIAIDLLSMGVMIYKELYPSAILFLVYGMLAIKGFYTWKKEVNLLRTR